MGDSDSDSRITSVRYRYHGRLGTGMWLRLTSSWNSPESNRALKARTVTHCYLRHSRYRRYSREGELGREIQPEGIAESHPKSTGRLATKMPAIFEPLRLTKVRRKTSIDEINKLDGCLQKSRNRFLDIRDKPELLGVCSRRGMSRMSSRYCRVLLLRTSLWSIGSSYSFTTNLYMYDPRLSNWDRMSQLPSTCLCCLYPAPCIYSPFSFID